MKDSQQKIDHETMSRLMEEQAKRYKSTGEKISLKKLITEAVASQFTK